MRNSPALGLIARTRISSMTTKCDLLPLPPCRTIAGLSEAVSWNREKMTSRIKRLSRHSIGEVCGGFPRLFVLRGHKRENLRQACGGWGLAGVVFKIPTM